MKVIGFSNYSVSGESATYKVVSSTRWLGEAAKKANIDYSITNGVKDVLKGDNIIFVPLGMGSFNSEQQKANLDKFLKINKDNTKYLMCDDPIHVDLVMKVAAGVINIKENKEGIGLLPSTIKRLKSGLLEGSIKVIIPSLLFKSGPLVGKSKYQEIFNKLHIQRINVGYFEYKWLPKHDIGSNDVVIVASMHNYNVNKINNFADKSNFELVEFSRYTKKVDQVTVQKAIAKSKCLVTIPLLTCLSGAGWYRSNYISCYKYNTLCVPMDKNEAVLYNMPNITDTIDTEEKYNIALSKQQKTLKKLIMDYKPTLEFIKNTFGE